MFRYLIVILSILFTMPSWSVATNYPASKGLPDTFTRLPGHVLPALAQAKRIDMGVLEDKSKELMTLTLVLKRDDQTGFDQYLRDVYDPKSKIYRKFLSQKEISAKFGPSRDSYNSVLSYLKKNGFELVEGSDNRLTLTVVGTRAEAERAMKLQVGDYRLGNRGFFANKLDPELPINIASSVQAIAGLSNLGRPYGNTKAIAKAFAAICKFGISLQKGPQADKDNCVSFIKSIFQLNSTETIDPPGWDQNNGTGQTVGIIAFDTFQMNDVADYLELIGQPATRIADVSEVKVNGGATPGDKQDEVLLDTSIILDLARGAKVVIYDAPFTGSGTSFQALFNAAINGGSTIISNSWAYCEDQTTLADVHSIDAIFQTAAAAGITILNASGDSGSTCLDGSANTVAVPADSPSATAVGGSSPTLGHGYTYGSEKWWDGALDIPPTGQGGFGVSKFFSKPSYQNVFSASPMRSVPDVVVNADPTVGDFICQAAKGGCPTGLIYGGTSAAAPQFAALVAILNQALGYNIGALNQAIYPFANTPVFHNAASMNSDIAHVGLGSPNLNLLFLQLSGQTLGAPNGSISEVLPYLEGPFPSSIAAYADGQTQVFVNVRLLDNNGNPVSGKTISLTANAGSHAVISPPSAVTTVNNGIAIFTLTDLVPENVILTATDTNDSIVLDQKPSITIVTPPASSAGINALPTSVNADGTSTATITVTLKDSLNRPTPGKLITLSQGGGHSIITGPNPSVTDANGQIIFTATDLVNETVTYSAVDVTDSSLPIPGNPQVTFSGGSGSACGQTTPLPVGQNGYTVTPFITGITAGPLYYGGINFASCTGIFYPAFLNGSVFVTNMLNGDLFKLGASGGTVSNANLLSIIGPTLISPVIGKTGQLYAVRVATTGDFTTGAILELDPNTGAIIRNVVSNLRCPFSLAIDPLSGDLFFDDGCSGNGSDDPKIYRVMNPASATPTLVAYAILPATPNGQISFAPNGTMYVDTGYFSATPTISVVSGTNVPGSPTVTTLPGVNSFFWVTVAGADVNGAATSLLISTSSGLELFDLTTQTPTLLSQNLGGGSIGPDGCLYSPILGMVYKLTSPGGGCDFTPGGASPALSLAMASGSPSPLQGNPETVNATLQNIPTTAGTAVFFSVTGANPQIKLVRADTNGKAAFTYSGVFAGMDTITATTTYNGATLSSSPVQITWAAGEHFTFLSLNLSPGGGTQNKPVNVTASLTDVSVNPAVALANQNVNFTLLNGGTCSGSTNTNGIASCSITPAILGVGTLTAQFSGTNQFIPASDYIGFNTMAVPVQPLPTVNITVTPTSVATGVNAVLTWSSANATSCTASGAWSGTQSTSGSLSVSQAQPGPYNYTLACTGPGGSASNTVTLTVTSPTGLIPFKSLSASIEVAKTQFELSAQFVLGLNSDGINPATEEVRLGIGNFVATLPAGSFKKGKEGKFTFNGKVNSVFLEIVITPSSKRGIYEITIEGQPPHVVGSVKQVQVELSIGNDGGKTLVTSKK